MARPTKTGLDYYPMDVGFLRDKKVRLLRTEFGASSVVFVLYVLGKVYEGDGYFLSWDRDELLLAADELGETTAYISEVLQGCLSRSLFDKRVFQVFGVLTSAGIQRRYLRGCEKRDVISVFHEYWLLEEKEIPAGIRAKLALVRVSGEKTPVSSPGNPVNSPGNPQSKVKESKGKERKETTTTAVVSGTAPAESSSAWEYYRRNINPAPSELAARELLEYERELGTEVVIRACQEAQDNRVYRWRYIRGILEEKKRTGIRSAAEWDAAERERRERRGVRSHEGGEGGGSFGERL